MIHRARSVINDEEVHKVFASIVELISTFIADPVDIGNLLRKGIRVNDRVALDSSVNYKQNLFKRTWPGTHYLTTKVNWLE